MFKRPRRVGAACLALATIACASERTHFRVSHASGARPANVTCDADDGVDGDGDGISDVCEQDLAERFAPIVFHSSSETNFPTDVDAHLRGTALAFYDDDCAPDLRKRLVERPTQRDLLDRREGPSCGSNADVSSSGTRSKKKQRTFFLEDVAGDRRGGSADTREWTTYFHAYKNDEGGVTIQYWRFYAFNDALNDHGGDWEGTQVVLDRTLHPIAVRLLGHSSIEELAPSDLEREGSHFRVFSEIGGHATRSAGNLVSALGCFFDKCTIDPNDARTFVRQETWSRGTVSFPDGRASETGRLVNIGAKNAPLGGQVFVRYSGLWGSPGTFYSTSGYWGPAFNETDMRADGFVTAWCAGMVGEDLKSECYADATSR